MGYDIGAQQVLSKLAKKNYKIILFTMRSGKELQDAVEWFKTNKIPLFGINSNPEQREWTTSPKVYAHFYIDDAAIGCPLHHLVSKGRPYVDWIEVENLLTQKGLL
jgi:hypothetical protein